MYNYIIIVIIKYILCILYIKHVVITGKRVRSAEVRPWIQGLVGDCKNSKYCNNLRSLHSFKTILIFRFHYHFHMLSLRCYILSLYT